MTGDADALRKRQISGRDGGQKPATVARMYDCFLGGFHSFPADRDAATALVELWPCVPTVARANRAFVARAARHLLHGGIRQFLDIGCGIPGQNDNIHEIAQTLAPESRIVYVDTDPVAVADVLDLLGDTERATAIRGDVGEPQQILNHRQVRRLLDFTEPIGLLLCAVLHYVPDDTEAYESVAHLAAALTPGSYLVISHAAAEVFAPQSDPFRQASRVYQSHTGSFIAPRSRSAVQQFFTGLQVEEPGLVWTHEWRPDHPHQGPTQPGSWAATARKTTTDSIETAVPRHQREGQHVTID